MFRERGREERERERFAMDEATGNASGGSEGVMMEGKDLVTQGELGCTVEITVGSLEVGAWWGGFIFFYKYFWSNSIFLNFILVQ